MNSNNIAMNENEDSNEKLNRTDLLKLLSCLEAKLQGSEIVIAALKNDQLKRLFYPPVIRRPAILNKKSNQNSLNYATIIPTGKIRDREETNLNDNLDVILNTNLDEECDKSSTQSETNGSIDNLNKEFNDNHDLKKGSIFPNNKYNEYRKNLETNPYLSLASDFKYANPNESHESLIIKVYNSRVLRLKEFIQQQEEARKFFESQLNELSTRYKNVVDELEVEKGKNVRFKRDETIKKLEKSELEKKELENELNNLKKEYDTEKEREKIMICYLLSERKQLIIRLIEESEKNTELVNLLSSEKNRSAEMEEGLEEESKRSLQMEIDLECLTNKYELERSQLEERITSYEKRNQELEDECYKLKQKLNELMNSNSVNNNNSITTNKNLLDLGEGVRSTIVTFNNVIAAKPSPAIKPSFDSISNTTNGKQTVTIINNQPIRSNSAYSKASTSSINKINNNNPTITTTTTSTSVASVIQKFSNNSISNSTNTHHIPIVKKLSSSGLVANIAQSIVGQQQNNSTRGPPPPIPIKPSVNPQLLKERTAKLLEQQQTST